MAPQFHYPGLEMDGGQLSPLPAEGNRKDYFPIPPVRKITPVLPPRAIIDVNPLTTSKNHSIAVNPSLPKGNARNDTVPIAERTIGNSPGKKNAYGYASASPDVSKKVSCSSAAELYGYESGSPDVARGGSKVVSDNTDHYRTATATNFQYDGTRVPRRSSLKASSSYGGGPLGSQSYHGERRQRRNSLMEVRVRGSQNPVQRRRSIDFSNKVHVKEVEPVKEMTENIRDLWLQAEDFAQMKEHRRSLLEKYKERHRTESADNLESSNTMMGPPLTSKHHEADPDDSFRGLERYIDKSGRRQKNMAWDTVFLEQDEQECSGFYDEHRIAELYKYTTQESPEKAFARAQQDQEAVQEYLTSPRTTKLMARTRFEKFLRRVSC